MTMKHILALTCLIFLFLVSYPQSDAPELPGGWGQHNQSSLFIGSINERMRVSHNVLNSGKGLGLEAGINPAWFFNSRLTLGVFAGVAMRDVFYNTKFSDAYINDFNRSFNGTGLQGNDSLVANQYARLIGKAGFHDREVYYGIVFRLPYKWAPVVKLYTGWLYWVYKTDNHLPVKPDSDTRNDNDEYDIDHRISWGAEVFLFPGYTRVGDYHEFPFIKKRPLTYLTYRFPISFFIERISTAHSTYHFDTGELSVNLPQERILSPSFIDQYKSNYYFGFRISYGCF